MAVAAVAAGIGLAGSLAETGYSLASSNDPGRQASEAERQRQQRIALGTQSINQAFQGYNPAFYQQRARAYVNQALPQFNQQYRQANAQLGFNLANQGLLGSGAQQNLLSQLGQQRAQGLQQVYDQGQSQAQSLQQQVESARQTALNQLYQSADPASARQQAISSASQFQQPSAFGPLSNMFSNLSNQYYLNALSQNNNPNQAALAYLAGQQRQPSTGAPLGGTVSY